MTAPAPPLTPEERDRRSAAALARLEASLRHFKELTAPTPWYWQVWYFVQGAAVVLACIGALLAVVVVAPLWVIARIDAHNCAYAGRQLHTPSHFDWLAGCYVTVNGGAAVPLDQYRVVGGVR